MSNSACDHQLNGHSGHAPCASPLPRAAPTPGSSVDSLSCVPVPAFANRGLARPPARPQGRPIDLRQVGASRRGLDQRSTLHSFGSPLPILSNCLAAWAKLALCQHVAGRSVEPGAPTPGRPLGKIEMGLLGRLAIDLDYEGRYPEAEKVQRELL